jgi:hypothetical protein
MVYWKAMYNKNMPIKTLKKIAKENPDPDIRDGVKRILKERRMNH